MKKKSYLSVFATLLAFAAIMACGDSATDTTKTEGDPNDPNYVQARAMTEGYVDSLFYVYNEASAYITFDGQSPQSTAADSSSVIFDPETCWWEVYASSDSTGYSFLLIDSVKFEDASGCQMFPDSTTTTSIEYRLTLSLDVVEDSGYVDMTFDQGVLITGIQSEQVTLNSSGAADFGLGLVLDQGTLDFDYAYDGNVTDLVFNRDEIMADTVAHPISGAMDLSATMDIGSPNGAAHSTWLMHVTFFVDHYHVYAESGDNYWEWDVYYEPGPIM